MPATSFAVLWRDHRAAADRGGRRPRGRRGPDGDAVRHSGLTVTEVVSEHIDPLTAVGADTRVHYLKQFAAHISPSIGPYLVSSMSYRHMAGWVRAVSEKGPAPTMIANVHGSLSAAMTTAVRLGYRADGGGRRPCVSAGDAARDEGVEA